MAETRQFAFVTEGEVFFIHEMSSLQPNYTRLCSAYENNPIFVQCSEDENATLIRSGWTWDGTSFSPPSE